MRRIRDEEAASKLSALLKTRPSDLVEQAIKLGGAAPQDWRRMRVSDIVRRLRHRFDMTQRQLAGLSGFPHSMIARIERGEDLRVSTLYQLLAGFGCDLVFLPVSRLSAEALWRRTWELSSSGLIPRKRRYSRR